MEDILKKDGLSYELLKALSYQSTLGIRLKRNLHYFDKQTLFNELERINEWYDTCNQLQGIAIDYRIKSLQSSIQKYERYYPDHQTAKVFNDLLGFRSLCDNYEDVLQMTGYPDIHVADMSNGKSNDDGYRGVHVYFQLSKELCINKLYIYYVLFVVLNVISAFCVQFNSAQFLIITIR